VRWCVVFGVWFHELQDCVIASEGNFYIGVFEKVCDFSNVWGCVCESRPFGVDSGFYEWCSLGYFLLYLLFQSNYKVFWWKLLLCAILSMVFHSLR
jgi:hypothetical protein